MEDKLRRSIDLNNLNNLNDLSSRLESLNSALNTLVSIDADKHTIRVLEDRKEAIKARIKEAEFDSLPEYIKAPVDRTKADKKVTIKMTRGEFYLLHSILDGDHAQDLVDRAGYSYLMHKNEAKYDEFVRIVNSLSDKVCEVYGKKNNHDAGLI